MLTIDNNDVYGIENYNAPEELEFFDCINHVWVDELFPYLDEDEVLEVELLVKDYHRLFHQCEELMRLVPLTAVKVSTQTDELINIVEKQIAKIIRHNIHYRKVLQ